MKRELEEWLALGAVTVFFALILGAFVYMALDVIGGSRAKDACRDRGGIIEHYNTDRPSYWRCNVSAEVKP